MGYKRDVLASLGWEKKIRNLRDHVSLNPSPQHDIGAANRYDDDYDYYIIEQQ